MFNVISNYSEFLQENSELFESVNTTSSVIVDDVEYAKFKAKLLSGLEESQVKTVEGLFDQQRAILIEEASEMLGSAEAISYAVASFPILVDVYSQPILAKIVSTFPSDKPTMSIPRLKWEVSTIDYQGTKVSWEFPDATRRARPGSVEVKVSGNKGNIFTILNITDKDNFRINSRNIKITKIYTGATTFVDASIGIDARGNIISEVVRVGTDTDYVDVSINGVINVETGEVRYSVVEEGSEGTAPTIEAIGIVTRVLGTGTGIGVVKSKPKMGVIDINTDVTESFEIENIEEIIQDWKSLYNIDIISQLKDYIKSQMELNKDYDIAELLEGTVAKSKALGLYRQVDLGATAGSLVPGREHFQNFFRSIIPAITMVVESIKYKSRLTAKYLVCGIDTGAILKSVQEMAVKFEDKEGEIGFVGGVSEFAKLEIVVSFAIPTDMIYVVTKQTELAQSTIVEISHKPFYVIQETTNARKRTFFRSRNWLGIVRPEGIGAIKVTNYNPGGAAFGQKIVD
jgi:hypothetical protein